MGGYKEKGKKRKEQGNIKKNSEKKIRIKNITRHFDPATVLATVTVAPTTADALTEATAAEMAAITL